MRTGLLIFFILAGLYLFFRPPKTADQPVASRTSEIDQETPLNPPPQKGQVTLKKKASKPNRKENSRHKKFAEMAKYVESEENKYLEIESDLREDNKALCEQGIEYACVLSIEKSERDHFIDVVGNDEQNNVIQEAAEVLLQKALPLCKKGYPKACFSANFVFTNLSGVFSAEENQYRQMMEERCKYLYKHSCLALSSLIRYGGGSKLEISEHERNSCVNGDSTSCQRYGRIMLDENITAAIWAFERMCKLQPSRCPLVMSDIPKREMTAEILNLVQKMCPADRLACGALGVYYQDSDSQKAAHYFTESCLKSESYCPSAVDTLRSIGQTGKAEEILDRMCPEYESKMANDKYYRDLYRKYCR